MKLTPALLMVALVGAAALWNAWCDNPRVRRQAELVVAGERLNQSVDSLNRAAAARAADSAARALQERRTNDSLRALARAIDHARQRGDSLTQLVRAAGEMVARPLVAALLLEHDREVLGLKLTIGMQTVQLLDSARTLAAMRLERTALERQRDEALAQRNKWRREASHRFSVRPCAFAGGTVPQFEARVGVGVCIS